MKCGVITDGISRDFEHALNIMAEFELEYAELQYLWDKEVGDLDAGEIQRAKGLLEARQMKVACISRHNFVGMGVHQTAVGDSDYQKHMEGLKRCIGMAQDLSCPRVRIMSFCEMIVFGKGAEEWVVSTGAWEKLLELLHPPVELAARRVQLVLETGNNAMIPSAWMGAAGS